jgi:GH43 family beta-xylosidase
MHAPGPVLEARPLVSRSLTVVRILRLLPAVLLLAACGGDGGNDPDTGTHTPLCATTFMNPIGPGADPWVVRSGTSYYSVESRDGGIWVYRSDTLPSLRRNAAKVWSPSGTGWNRQDIWAPELHHIGSKWYIYYAAGQPGNGFQDQRAGVLESTGDDPSGTWIDRGMLYTGDDVAGGTNPVWAIDLTVREINGQLYAVWSGWEQNTTNDRTPQHLYIARMSSPTTIATNRVRISSPTESWEVGTELNLQEGPEFLAHGDDLFIVYSTRESFLPDYRLGTLRLASPTADPLSPASWTKSSGPVFTGAPALGVYGVGHASFTKSPDGTEDWIVYHAKSLPNAGWDDRVVRMQKFTWNADGTPNFGTPTASNVPVASPSGQCAATP